MRSVAVGCGLVLWVGFVAAQEPLPPERAQQAAQLLARAAAKLTDVPVKTDVDTHKAYGLKRGELAVLVIPNKDLSEDRLGKAGKDVQPVGQLWLRGLTPITAGSAVPSDKLRLVKVKAKNQEHELPLFLLGIRKGTAGKMELLVYARAKKPMLVLPVEAANRTQEQPIEVEGKGEGERGELVLSFLGKYQAKLPIARAP